MPTILTVDRTCVNVVGMTDIPNDPGPMPVGIYGTEWADATKRVNAMIDRMVLTDHERRRLIDYLAGHSPSAVATGLRWLQDTRQDRTSTPQRIVPDGFTAGIFGVEG